MTTSNKPKNQNPNGLHDLGQITIPEMRKGPITDKNDLRIYVTYYGTRHGKPDDKAQISLMQEQWSACAYLTPFQLRELASQLCAAATAIDEGQALFETARYEMSLL